jgi:hypothetical protein
MPVLLILELSQSRLKIVLWTATGVVVLASRAKRLRGDVKA